MKLPTTLVSLLLLLFSSEASAFNAASVAAGGDGPGITGSIGVPDVGMGSRIPLGATDFRLVVGTSLKPSLRAPEINVGLSWRRNVWRFVSLEVTPTAGVLVPLVPTPALAFRGEVLGRGMLTFRWARLWTGLEASTLLQSVPTLFTEAGGSWVLGGAVRLWWLELGAATSLGARGMAAFRDGPRPDGVRPDARVMFTLDVGKPFKLTREDLPWRL